MVPRVLSRRGLLLILLLSSGKITPYPEALRAYNLQNYIRSQRLKWNILLN